MFHPSPPYNAYGQMYPSPVQLAENAVAPHHRHHRRHRHRSRDALDDLEDDYGYHRSGRSHSRHDRHRKKRSRSVNVIVQPPPGTSFPQNTSGMYPSVPTTNGIAQAPQAATSQYIPVVSGYAQPAVASANVTGAGFPQAQSITAQGATYPTNSTSAPAARSNTGAPTVINILPPTGQTASYPGATSTAYSSTAPRQAPTGYSANAVMPPASMAAGNGYQVYPPAAGAAAPNQVGQVGPMPAQAGAPLPFTHLVPFQQDPVPQVTNSVNPQPSLQTNVVPQQSAPAPAQTFMQSASPPVMPAGTPIPGAGNPQVIPTVRRTRSYTEMPAAVPVQTVYV